MLFPIPSTQREIYLRFLRWRIVLRHFRFFSRPRIRRVFHWKWSGVWFPLLWASGLAMLGLSLTSESVDLPIWPTIVLSYVLFASAMAWSVGCWLTSDIVVKRDPIAWSKTKLNRATGNPQRRYRLIKWSVTFAIAVIFATALWATYETNYRIELRHTEGVLIPASDATPSMCGPIADGDVLLEIGTHDNGSIAHKFPHVFLRSLHLGDIISIDRLADGTLAVLMEIRDPQDGKLIARLNRHGFKVSDKTFGKIIRPDRSSLVVTDEYGVETLNIRYRNRNTIRIQGAFHYPGQRKETPYEMRGISGVCTTGADNQGADFEIW